MRWLAPALMAVALFVGDAAPVVAPPTVEREPVMVDQPPTPKPTTLTGVASWYGLPGTSRPTVAWYTRANEFGKPFRFYAAAGPALRAFLGKAGNHFYHVHHRVEVCATVNGLVSCIIADVVDWCGCSRGNPHEKAIDLSPAAFQALGVPLSRGIVKVTIRRIP